ncbi:putative GNAT family N-acetyltransferase [Colletotrichum truncatum]|uniref:GNAT family N-acetyltransferase n=1 Tax=Colletotrichum truncatum TaxID=5467 RepID=A0ACC3ZD33_COLTU|nr:putative GNAT family N-acetyltransferase [Colletotrichum truncatum]KAF6797982.1 putative GNAT family N-acetyltransferase [Colletotrichum truncatum]
MPNQIPTKQWYKDDYLISTDRSLLQLDAINNAFDSELLWWARRVPEHVLQRMIDNSLCLGVYKLPQSTVEIAGSLLPSVSRKKGPELVGLARVVTDYVSLAYLADVYVLQEHQGRGLAPWLMECLNEMLDEWPELRRFLLLTSSPQASKLYEKTLRTTEWGKSYDGKLYLLERRGPAVPDGPEDDDNDD